MAGRIWNYASTMALAAIISGCAAPSTQSVPTPSVAATEAAKPTQPAVIPTAYQVPAAGPESSFAPLPPHSFAPSSLNLDQLLADVEARNPSLQAAEAAWNAAAQRYPQAVSLEDPMFTCMISPTSGLGGQNGGWSVQGSQRLPWPGKRDLKGEAAAADADAMRGEMGDTRQRLAEMTQMAFYDYYLADRLLGVNESTRRLLEQFRQLARTQYEASRATEQDVLQADVELAAAESRATELARDRRVAAARINTLLHQPPDSPLPPPPAELPLSAELPPLEALQATAAQTRPDLYAAHARVQSEEASLALAQRDYYPDIDLMAKYDAFMPEDIRPAIGMQMNVPLHNDRRSAAVCEAESRVEQRRWEYQNLLDGVRFDVESAYARAEQARKVVGLYRERILPLGRRNIDSARANYTSSKLDFLRLIDAQRQLNTQQEMYFQAIADCHRRLAELDRAAGTATR